MQVLYPFGHGLSYTQFTYSGLRLSADSMRDTENLTVSVDVQNTGNLFGKEVVQLYVAPQTTGVLRPDKELKGF